MPTGVFCGSFADPLGREESGSGSLVVHELRWPGRAGAGRILAELELAHSAWLLVPMAWMPGWEYRLAGGAWQPTEPAVGPFQTVALPAGRQRLELRYLPSSFLLGLGASTLGLVLLLSLLFFGARREFPGDRQHRA